MHFDGQDDENTGGERAVDPLGEQQKKKRRILADVRPLQESPAFRRLWIGQSFSTAGSMITGVVAAIQVYQISHSTWAVGLVGLAEALPTIAFGLFGGVIADTFDRRRLVMVTSVLSAVVGALFTLQAAADFHRLWPLFVLTALQSCLSALTVPATRTFMPQLLPRERYAAAAALQQVSFQAAVVAGPLLAGGLVAWVGTSTAYAVDALSFLTFAYAALRLPPMQASEESEEESTGLKSATEGLRFVRDQPILRTLLLLDLNSMVFGMPMALFPAFAEHQLHSGPQTTGLLYAAPALGGVIGATLSGSFSRIRRQGVAVLLASSVWGLAIVGFGLSSVLWLAVLLLAVAGVADIVNGVFRSTILQVRTPDALRGRVNAVGFVVAEAGPHMGNVEAGAVGSLTSPSISAVSGGLACLVGVLVAVLTAPVMLRYDAHDDVSDAGVQAVSDIAEA